MSAESDDVVASYRALTRDSDKAVAATQIAQESQGLFDLDSKTRRLIWAAVFGVLLIIALGAIVIIWHSYSIDITTTTGTGTTAVTATSHPDVSAAWALLSAVVAGIVGLLVPSPTATGTA